MDVFERNGPHVRGQISARPRLTLILTGSLPSTADRSIYG